MIPAATTSNGYYDRNAVLSQIGEDGVRRVLESVGIDGIRNAGANDWNVRAWRRDDGRNPDVSVRKTDGTWVDHKTSDAGSIYDIVMDKRGCTYPEAVQYVAERGGASVPTAPIPIESKRQEKRPFRWDKAMIWQYADEDGLLLYEVGRIDYGPGDKDFSQRRIVGAGYSSSLGDVKRVPYRLGDMINVPLDTPIIKCEGEKAADCARALGFVATTNAGGVNGWKPELNEYFRDRLVVLIPDNDDEGRKHVRSVAQQLNSIAREVRVLDLPNLPEKGDIVEWVAAGGTAEQLRTLIEQTPIFRLDDVADDDLTVSSLVIESFTDVEEVEIDWLWERWLARRKITLLGGVEGDGKTTLMCHLAATFSNGGMLPDGTQAPVSRVLFLLSEDGADDTIKPRLVRNGANTDNVFWVKAVREPGKGQTIFSLSRNLPDLEAAIRQHKIDIVVIDPISAFMQKSNRKDEGEVRDMMMPLVQMADRAGVSVIGLVHLGKSAPMGGRAHHRVLNSVAFAAIARTVWMIAPASAEQDEPNRVIAVAKSNLSMKPRPMEWCLPSETSPVKWLGPSSRSIDELLGSGGGAGQNTTPERAEILALLKGSADPLKPSQIANTLDKNLSTVTNLLKKMRDQGEVIQPMYGAYAVPRSVAEKRDDNVRF